MRALRLAPLWLVATFARAEPPLTPPDWLASLMAEDGGIVCGGALVDAIAEANDLGDSPMSCRLTILTARHCLNPTIPACAAVGPRLGGCSQLGALKMQSFDISQVRVGEQLSMPDGDLSLIRLRVPGSCARFHPLDTDPCPSGSILELWSWRDGVVHRRTNVSAAFDCPWAPGTDLAGRPPVDVCPADWLLFGHERVTGNECRKLDDVASPRESGGVLVCRSAHAEAFAGVLSQRCDTTASFVAQWRTPVADLAGRSPVATIDELLGRARACGVGLDHCVGVGNGGHVRVLD